MIFSAPRLYLTLFFTRGVSLQLWARIGILSRETALYQKLQAQGVHVSFLTYGDKRDLDYQDQIPGIEILCNRWRLPLPLYERLIPILHARALRKSHIFKTNQSRGSDVALRAGRFLAKPLVARCGYLWSEFEAEEKGVGSPATLRARRVERHVFQSAKRVVVTTSEMANMAKQMSKHPVIVIPNYVDTDLFQPAPNVEKKYDVIFVGRLAEQKNVIQLLHAVQALNVRTLLIGSGKFNGLIQALCERSGQKIQWKKSVPNQDLPRYFNQSKVLALPSQYEGHPKVLIEAMACGLAVVGADVVGIRSLIEHGKTGILCDTSENGIQFAVQKLLADSALRRHLGHSARRYVLEHFDLNDVARLEYEMLEEVRHENK